MKNSCIIFILLTAAAIWHAGGTAYAWTRTWYNRHDIHDRYGYYYRHHGPFHHRPHWHIHNYHPRYKNLYTEKDAWELIENNRSYTALQIFEGLFHASPAAGRLKLGAAVAAADAGQLSKSIELMRQVLQYNPGSLQVFEPETWLTDRLKGLTKKFQEQSNELPGQDARFMLAAFYYLVKDREACLRSVQMGKAANDVSDSALNLFYMAENDAWRFQPNAETVPK